MIFICSPACQCIQRVKDPVVQRQRFANQLKVHLIVQLWYLIENCLNFFTMIHVFEFRTDNQVMMKQWLWTNHSVELLSTGYLLLVVRVWALIALYVVN